MQREVAAKEVAAAVLEVVPIPWKNFVARFAVAGAALSRLSFGAAAHARVGRG